LNADGETPSIAIHIQCRERRFHLRTLIAFLLATAPLAGCAAPQIPKPLQGVRRIVVMGDSITQGGGGPGGYVWLLQKTLDALYPAQGIEVINAGVSGHRSTDMAARFQRDVLDRKPDLVTINAGVNDVWHGFYDWQEGKRHPDGDLPAGVPLATYREKVGAMVDAALAAHVRAVLVSPTLIYEDLGCAENVRLTEYCRAMREIAREKRCIFVDLNTPFREVVGVYRKYAGAAPNLLTTDGVHMNPLGYKLMAQGILRGLGLTDAQIAAASSRS
jgi:lysophospholipase L1-like esterase